MVLKRYIFMLLAAVLVLGACTNGNNGEENEADNTEEESNSEDNASDENAENENESIGVDDGLFSVEISIPPSLLEDEDIDEVIEGAKAAGVSEVEENEDGSLTYKMSKSAHREMMDELKESVDETMEEIKNDEEFASIKDVTANDSFSDITMHVSQEEFENSFDAFAALGLAFPALFYQLFDGVDPDDYEVAIHIENADTGEVFDTVIYPDAFEEDEEQ